MRPPVFGLPLVSSGRRIALVSVSMDLGAGRRGVDMGPSAIRIAGLSERLSELGLDVLEVGTVHAPGPETLHLVETRARFLAEVGDTCRRVYELVEQGLSGGGFPLILGGDHSLAIGTIAAVAAHYAQQDEQIGLLWVDAHADMNTPATTPSGNVHGMPLAILTGQGGPEELGTLAGFSPAVHPGNVCLFGVRSVDAREKEIVRRSGVRVFTMSEIDERGIAACMDEALTRVTSQTAGFHLSMDLDAIDPMVAPGVGTPVPGGLNYREAHLVCEKSARSGHLLSLEVVELNPVLDSENRTGKLAVGLVSSALGKTIL